VVEVLELSAKIFTTEGLVLTLCGNEILLKIDEDYRIPNSANELRRHGDWNWIGDISNYMLDGVLDTKEHAEELAKKIIQEYIELNGGQGESSLD
jgi:hypothetical protein